jgi:hypothetical protein
MLCLSGVRLLIGERKMAKRLCSVCGENKDMSSGKYARNPLHLLSVSKVAFEMSYGWLQADVMAH